MKNRNINKIVSKVLKETLEDKIEGIESEIENMNELEEGFDDEFIKKYRDDEDFSEKEFKPIPLGKGKIGIDQNKLDRNTGVSIEKEFTDDFLDSIDLRDLMGDDITGSDDDDDLEPMREGKEMCEQCGAKNAIMEGECSECGYKMESEMKEGIYDVDDIDNKSDEFYYVQEDTLDFEDFDSDPTKPNVEGCKATMEIMRSGQDCPHCEEILKNYNCAALNESLSRRQKKYLDKNKNNKIDSEDFKLLRKGEKKETKEGEKFPDLSGDGKVTRKDVLMGRGVKFGKKKDMQEKWEGDVDVEKTGEHSGKSIEQINSEIKKLKDKTERLKNADKKVPKEDREKMSELYFAKRAKQGWKGKGKAAVKESVQLTEEEMIDLIENIIKEQKTKETKLRPIGKPRGLETYEKAHKGSGKENEDYIKSVAKKMKEYLKDGSKGEYTESPKHFPKGNGQLEKMKAKKYTMSKDGSDFLDDYMRPGMENLVPDEIQYDEEWVSDNIKGSSRTGNNPKWANAEETELGDKINKKRKDKKYHKVKMAAYRKSKQPVTDGTGEMAGEGINIKLESENVKQLKMLNEEFSRISNLMSYNRKTQ